MDNEEKMNNEEPLAPFMNKEVGRNAWYFGLITGAVLILFSLLTYVFDLYAVRGLNNVSFLFLVVGIVYGIWYYKNKVNEGYLTIGKGVASGTLIALYAGIISALFGILMMTVIDPTLPERILEMAEEEILRQRPDISDQEFDMAMSIYRRMSNPVLASSLALIFQVIVGLIISLIASAIMKKEPETIS